MNEARQFHRGDVLLVSLPFVTDLSQAKIRPAVVIQNDAGNRFSPNLIVVAISSQIPRRQYPTVFIVRAGSPAAARSGLERDSVVQASVIFTVPKGAAIRRLGRFNAAAMEAIDRCVRVSLGLI